MGVSNLPLQRLILVLLKVIFYFWPFLRAFWGLFFIQVIVRTDSAFSPLKLTFDESTTYSFPPKQSSTIRPKQTPNKHHHSQLPTKNRALQRASTSPPEALCKILGQFSERLEQFAFQILNSCTFMARLLEHSKAFKDIQNGSILERLEPQCKGLHLLLGKGETPCAKGGNQKGEYCRKHGITYALGGDISAWDASWSPKKSYQHALTACFLGRSTRI